MATSFATAMLLAVIAILCYLIMVKNRNVLHLLNSKRLFVIISAIWFIAILSSAPAVIGFWGKLVYDPYYGICIPDFYFTNNLNHLTYYILITIIFFCCINCTSGYCYYSIYKHILSKKRRAIKPLKAKKQQKHAGSRLGNRCSYNPQTVQTLWNKKQERVNLVLLMIFLGYLISYSPAAIATFLEITNTINLNILQYSILLILMYSNSVLDPYIILLSSQRYRNFLRSRMYQCVLDMSQYSNPKLSRTKIVRLAPIPSKVSHDIF
ncbi:Blue-sensitive opsin [Trichoplax sp. H2]|nr:Blue-sensitive opsin [Trichoplax sp. H2]|eukprot:RDD39212.1 Blue-sensitive opsin [Trichoplax sp. H2]